MPNRKFIRGQIRQVFGDLLGMVRLLSFMYMSGCAHPERNRKIVNREIVKSSNHAALP